ncbi:unnamed protein product [Symbiodinium natans]|uniref:Uncharacterized protein n=1 Tax=Symbiodinium natans TaxID=878477 RepID=A0A812V7C1_9DINO|nr:unnamed protein product [Symbiodinium natans]
MGHPSCRDLCDLTSRNSGSLEVSQPGGAKHSPTHFGVNAGRYSTSHLCYLQWASTSIFLFSTFIFLKEAKQLRRRHRQAMTRRKKSSG